MPTAPPPPGDKLRLAVANTVIARVAGWPIDLQVRTAAAMNDYVNHAAGEYPDRAYLENRPLDFAAWIYEELADDIDPYLRTLDYRNWFDKTLPPAVDIVDVARLKGRRP